jgi:uncharacterized protein YbjQ (UPF0145 family)
MWTCETCGENIDDKFDTCWKCAGQYVGEIDPEGSLPDVQQLSEIDIPLVTTPNVPGFRLVNSVGIVCGEAIIGANIFSDMLAGIVDIVGGRSLSYEGKLQSARQIALAEMAQQAKDRGANAIIGVHVDYETLRGTMLMVCTTGTGVVVEAEST